jgi:hypothetical protein
VDDYSKFYATLGVGPDTDWETLRRHYKRLIGQWHPDRFSDDTAAKEVAEERSKQITIAYQALGNYVRKHGVLPPRAPAIELDMGDVQGPGRQAEPASDRVHSHERTATDTTHASVSEPSKKGPRRRHRVALAIFIIVPALYLADRYAGPPVPGESEPGKVLHHPDTATQAPDTTAQAPAESPRESGWIWIGSTLGDVYSAQGVPTSTEGETWHYGKSQIRFAQGKVISWNQHPDNPLRIARGQPGQIQEGTFEVGSTKNDVWAIQGAPVTETDTVWDYGPSRVYFKNNRVIYWEESPMRPLRVAH